MFIRTARLFLRPCWPEDRSDMLALINEGSANPETAGLPWPFTALDTQRFISRPSDERLPHFFITLPKANSGVLVGGIGLGRDGDEVGLGYWIARPHRGHGYGPEAIRAVLSMARTLGHKRVIASYIAGNPSSRRVLEKVGFKPTREVCSTLAQKQEGGAVPETYLFDLADSIQLEDNSAPTPLTGT